MKNLRRIFSICLILLLAFQTTNIIVQEHSENPIITHM